MATIEEIKSHIEDLQNRKERGSITPIYLGGILQEMADATKKVGYTADSAYCDARLSLTRDNITIVFSDSEESYNVPIPMVTNEHAGLMGADMYANFGTIQEQAGNAIKELSFENQNGELSLSVDRGDSDFTIPIPQATERSAGIMSSHDKARLDTVFNNCARNLRLRSDTNSGQLFVEYDTPSGTAGFMLPTATSSTNGLISSQNYQDIARITPIVDNLHRRNFETSSQFAFRSGVWVRLAEWRRGTHAVGDFTLRLRHLRFVASIHFTAFCSNVQGALYPGTRAGNLQFIDRITIATERSTGKTYLYVRLCEQLTEQITLPTLELLTQGIGWTGLTPTPIAGEVNDTTHAGRTEMVVSSISHTATEQQDGFMSSADKRKLDAMATSIISLGNDTTAKIEKIKQRLIIPIDVNIVGLSQSNERVLELTGDIPEGYMPVVFRKIRRTTKMQDGGYPRPLQWYFYGTANIVNRDGKQLISFNQPFRGKKQESPYIDHNPAPSPIGEVSCAHDFVLIHNVDKEGIAGSVVEYPEKFDLRAAWGRAGKRSIFIEKENRFWPETIRLELGVGLVKTEVYEKIYVSRSRERRMTKSDLSSNFVTFKIVTQRPEEWQYSHTYKPRWYFTT